MSQYLYYISLKELHNMDNTRFIQECTKLQTVGFVGNFMGFPRDGSQLYLSHWTGKVQDKRFLRADGNGIFQWERKISDRCTAICSFLSISIHSNVSQKNYATHKAMMHPVELDFLKQ